MPGDDGAIPCAEQHAATPYQTSMEEQAAYAIQAVALAASSGYERIGFYQMVDGGPCGQPAVGGITRDDGSRRPVADALQTAVTYLSGFSAARFEPIVRSTTAWSAWPAVPTSYTPNWRTYRVSFDFPDGRRVTVLWNGDATDSMLQVPRGAGSAVLLDQYGAAQELRSDGDNWLVSLPGATARFYVNEIVRDPAGYHFIGGAPRLLVEPAP